MDRELAAVGVTTVGHATVGDERAELERLLRDAAGRCDLLLVSGGIGPTPDDLTREALANVLGEELVVHEWWLDRLAEIWANRDRPMPENNRKQAAAPASGELLDNPVGTAGGVAATIGDCRVFVVPGVPREAKEMFAKHVLPWATKAVQAGGGAVVRTRALHTFGLGESDLAQRLGDLLDRGRVPGLEVGTTAARGVVSVRAYARAVDVVEAVAKLDDVENRVRDTLGDVVFGIDDEDLAAATARCLRDHPRQPIVSLAESCTGGLIAKLITDVPGSSAHFHRGFVTYSNASKIELLGVPRDLLEQHGAVSEPVAAAMATGVRTIEGHGVSLAVTGVAGPAGGTDAKPVGTVCIALAAPGDVVVTHTFRFHGNREMIRLRTAYTALTMLRLHLLGHERAGLELLL